MGQNASRIHFSVVESVGSQLVNVRCFLKDDLKRLQDGFWATGAGTLGGFPSQESYCALILDDGSEIQAECPLSPPSQWRDLCPGDVVDFVVL